MPPTYVIDYELNRRLLNHRHKPGMVYIVKNPRVQRRRGIFVARSLEEVYDISRQIKQPIVQPLIKSIIVKGHRISLRSAYIYLLLTIKAELPAGCTAVEDLTTHLFQQI